MRRHALWATTLLLGTVAGLLLASPAGGHVTRRFVHLWNSHITQEIAYERVTQDSAFDEEDMKTVIAECPPGKEVVGGGYGIAGAVSNIVVWHSRALYEDDGWLAGALKEGGDGGWSLHVEAICANLSPDAASAGRSVRATGLEL